MKRINHIIFIFLGVIFTLLQSCTDKTKYVLKLEDRSIVNYGTTQQPIARVYKAKFKKLLNDATTLDGANEIDIENSRDTKSLAILIKPKSGGMVAKYIRGQDPHFYDSIALGTDGKGEIQFLWQAGKSMGYQSITLELVLVANPTTANGEAYIPIALSNLELQVVDTSPLAQPKKLSFKSNIIDEGTIIKANGEEIPIGAIGDEQSGFKQIWTAKNLKPDMITEDTIYPDNDPNNLEEYGGLFSSVGGPCPDGYFLASLKELECLEAYVNRGTPCILGLPPMSMHKQLAGYKQGVSVSLGFRNFGSELRIWGRNGYALGYGSGQQLGCVDVLSQSNSTVFYSVRCLKLGSLGCP